VRPRSAVETTRVAQATAPRACPRGLLVWAPVTIISGTIGILQAGRCSVVLEGRRRSCGGDRPSKRGKQSGEPCFKHHQGTVSFATSKWYTRAVFPLAILACSAVGTSSRISANISRDCGNVDSLCG